LWISASVVIGAFGAVAVLWSLLSGRGILQAQAPLGYELVANGSNRRWVVDKTIGRIWLCRANRLELGARPQFKGCDKWEDPSPASGPYTFVPTSGSGGVEGFRVNLRTSHMIPCTGPASGVFRCDPTKYSAP
jgi:hypothetical protein